MSSIDYEEAALQAVHSQTLLLPSGARVEVTATWRHWLEYEELQAFYDFSADQILELVVQQCEESGRDASLAFELVVAHAYAGCRYEEDELPEAETWRPNFPSSGRPGRRRPARHRA